MLSTFICKRRLHTDKNEYTEDCCIWCMHMHIYLSTVTVRGVMKKSSLLSMQKLEILRKFPPHSSQLPHQCLLAFLLVMKQLSISFLVRLERRDFLSLRRKTMRCCRKQPKDGSWDTILSYYCFCADLLLKGNKTKHSMADERSNEEGEAKELTLACYEQSQVESLLCLWLSLRLNHQ